MLSKEKKELGNSAADRLKRFGCTLGHALMFLIAALGPAQADGPPSNHVSTSLYGKAGLIEMPTALFYDTGHLSLTGMLKSPDNRVTMTFQPTPWFEGSFRYSVIENYSPSPARPDLYDRSFDFKVRLLKQNRWRPSVALGMQDFMGTGVFSSEYVVATWQTSHMNLSLGAGFGRFGSRGTINNPLGQISEKFFNRGKVTDIQQTGRPLSNQYFRGEDMGIFGGIEVSTPIQGLNFIAEYSSDQYEFEESRGIADADFPVNFGLSWRVSNNLELGASLLHGQTFAMRMTLQMNPRTQAAPPRLDPPRFRFRVRDETANAVGPLTGNSELYRQYASIQHDWAAAKGTGAGESGDFLGAEHVWNPWEKKDHNRSGPAPGVDMALVPKDADVTWRSITGMVEPATDRKPPDMPETHWRLARWQDLPDAETNSAASLAMLIDEGADAEASPAPRLTDPLSTTEAAIPGLEWPLTDENKETVAKAIKQAVGTQQIGAVAVDFDDTLLTLYYYNGKYHREAEAIGRLLAALTQAAPPQIETFRLVSVIADLQVSEITVPRASLERIVSNFGSPEELFNATTFRQASGRRPPDTYLTKGKYPSIDYGLRPSFRYSLFDPDDPMRYQISALVSGVAELWKGFSLSGIYRLNIYDNFDEIVRESNSVLPHVRSDFPNYLNGSEHGMETLVANYNFQPASGWYARAFAGYLEEMYGGAGAEILYRPYGKRWAVALEAEYVKQREFDRGFRFRDYETVTGFAKFYYEIPYEDLTVELNAGRYLAEDWGATFRITKTFDNGTEIGAFATFTDVPFDEFGEGSFDKGIIVKIPFHTFSFFDTKRIYSTVIRPLTRDGGAQVWSGTPLYDSTHGYSLGQIRRNWKAVFQ